MGDPKEKMPGTSTEREGLLAQIDGLKAASAAIREDIVTNPDSKWLKPQKLDDGEIGLPPGPITLEANQRQITQLSKQVK